MGIFDKLFGKSKTAEEMLAGRVNDAIARLSNASDRQKVVIAMELLKDPDYEVRGAVAAEIARLNIHAVGAWFELANRLADDYEEVRIKAAKAFWRLGGVDYAIRSLRDEYGSPAHMTRGDALRGIEVLRKTADDESVFEKLLEENWSDYPRG
jgi:hypothetical protein